MPRLRKKVLRNHQLASRRLGTLLIISGVVLIAIPQIFKNQLVKPAEPIKIDKKLLVTQTSAEPPVRIVIPKYNIDLPIVEAKVKSGAWELSETTASHGLGSAGPGQIGNMVIFAHARPGLFLPLRDIENDDVVYIFTQDRWYEYVVSDTHLVNPNETQVIAPTSDTRLTLFTCSGFMDSKRLIVTALPIPPAAAGGMDATSDTISRGRI